MHHLGGPRLVLLLVKGLLVLHLGHQLSDGLVLEVKGLKKRPDHNSSKSTNLAMRTWEPRTARRDLFRDMSLARKFVYFEEL